MTLVCRPASVNPPLTAMAWLVLCRESWTRKGAQKPSALWSLQTASQLTTISWEIHGCKHSIALGDFCFVFFLFSLPNVGHTGRLG